MTKKSLLLSFVFLAMSLTGAWAQSGDCGANGNNLTWNFDSSTGTLTISGTGAMADYDYEVSS
jgi:hypothetical protein